MKIYSYYADGSIAHAATALHREKLGPDYLLDYWCLWLSNGKKIVSSAVKFDEYYPGWRELPDSTPKKH